MQPNQAVKISSKITDADGKVTEAKLYYHVNGATAQSVEMLPNAAPDNSTYTATIPGVKDSSLVDFFICAKDDSSNTAISDSASSRYFYLVLNRPLTIQDVQYSPFGGGYGGYTNYHVYIP